MHWSVCTLLTLAAQFMLINTTQQMHLLNTENETNYTFCVTFCDITNTAWSITISQYHRLLKVWKKTKIRIWYNQVPHLTQDTKWESDKNTRKHHIQESKWVSPFPTGGHKAATNRHLVLAKTDTNNEKDPQKKHHLGMVSKKIAQGRN